MLTSSLRRLRRRLAREESGFTLVELLVSMGIFSVLLGIFMAAISQMTAKTIDVESTQMSRDELNRAFAQFDRGLRYASAVNFPGKGGSGNWYLEYQTKATKDNAPAFCTQYVVDATGHTLSYRTWTDADVSTLTAWRVAASRIVNDPTVAAEQPFTLTPAGSQLRNQSVALLIISKTPAGDKQRLNTRVVALNSSANSPSNDVDPSTPNVSKTPVCTGVSRP